MKIIHTQTWIVSHMWSSASCRRHTSCFDWQHRIYRFYRFWVQLLPGPPGLSRPHWIDSVILRAYCDGFGLMLKRHPQYGREALPSLRRRLQSDRWFIEHLKPHSATSVIFHLHNNNNNTETLFIRVRGPTIVDIIKIWRRKNLKNNNLWLYLNWNFSFSNYFYFLQSQSEFQFRIDWQRLPTVGKAFLLSSSAASSFQLVMKMKPQPRRQRQLSVISSRRRLRVE